MRPASPGGTERLRRDNTGLVLRELRRHGPATRAELAARTGLAKATVGVIVAALAEAGAVGEAESRNSGRGRPGRPVTLAGERIWGLGLELNVDYATAVAVDLAGEVRHRSTRSAGTAGPGEALLALAREARDAAGEGATLAGATLAVPGLVRADDRTVAWTPNLDLAAAGLASAGLAEAVGAALGGATVSVANDANCAAYAEAHHGAARGARHAVYLTGTVGIGAGIVEAGSLLRGAAGFAGEVGHLPVGDPGRRCGCGRRGCWEAAIGLHAVLSALGMGERESPLSTGAAIAARAEDPAVAAVLERLGHDVGLGVAVLAGVLDPEVVVLGGYFVPLGELVLGPARRTLDERLAAPAQPRPQLRLSSLGVQAAALGAAELSLGPVLAGALA